MNVDDFETVSSNKDHESKLLGDNGAIDNSGRRDGRISQMNFASKSRVREEQEENELVDEVHKHKRKISY